MFVFYHFIDIICKILFPPDFVASIQILFLFAHSSTNRFYCIFATFLTICVFMLLFLLPTHYLTWRYQKEGQSQKRESATFYGFKMTQCTHFTAKSGTVGEGGGEWF